MKDITIKNWFLMKEFNEGERYAITTGSIAIVKSTQKAVLLSIDTDYGTITSWAPKSAIDNLPEEYVVKNFEIGSKYEHSMFGTVKILSVDEEKGIIEALVLNSGTVRAFSAQHTKMTKLEESTPAVEETAAVVEEKEVKHFDTFDEVMQDSEVVEKLQETFNNLDVTQLSVGTTHIIANISYEFSRDSVALEDRAINTCKIKLKLENATQLLKTVTIFGDEELGFNSKGHPKRILNIELCDIIKKWAQCACKEEKMTNKEYAVINIKSREFHTSNEYRVCEVIDKNTFKAGECMSTLNGAIIKKDSKRFNWAMTGFRTEKEARKWMFDYRKSRER